MWLNFEFQRKSTTLYYLTFAYFRYEKLKPTAASFDADINKYFDVVISVQLQETVSGVHFLHINSDGLKSTITEHCSIWQQKLTALLFSVTDKMVNHVYYYIADNSTKLVDHV